MDINAKYKLISELAHSVDPSVYDGTVESMAEFQAIIKYKVATLICKQELYYGDNLTCAISRAGDMIILLGFSELNYYDTIHFARHKSIVDILGNICPVGMICSIISNYSVDPICECSVIFGDYIGYTCEIYDFSTVKFPSDLIPSISIPYTNITLVLSNFSDFHTKPMRDGIYLVTKNVVLPQDDRNAICLAQNLKVPGYRFIVRGEGFIDELNK